MTNRAGTRKIIRKNYKNEVTDVRHEDSGMTQQFEPLKIDSTSFSGHNPLPQPIRECVFLHKNKSIEEID